MRVDHHTPFNTRTSTLGFAAVLLVLILTLFLASCTSNERARLYGGTERITLDSGQRLVNVTWKDTDLWILTRKDSSKPTTYSFKEKSSFGAMEGEIIIEEK